MRIEIRPASLEDAEAMGEVMVTSFLQAHRGQMPDELWQKRRDEWTPEVSAAAWRRSILAQDPNESILVASLDGAIGGLAGACLVPPDASRLYALYVLPGHRGQGLGSVLLHEEAHEMAVRGARSLEVAVLAANHPARQFYERHGARLDREGFFDEEGTLLPELMYAWPSLAALLREPKWPTEQFQ